MDKIISFFKSIKENTTKKSLEKTFLLLGGLTFALFGLFWNLYSDIALKASSSNLFIGLLTAIVGGVFIFVGSTINSFDVKIKGIVFNSVGIALGLGNIIYLLVSNINNFIPFAIVTLVFMIIGTALSIAGLTLQVLRKIYKYDED